MLFTLEQLSPIDPELQPIFAIFERFATLVDAVPLIESWVQEGRTQDLCQRRAELVERAFVIRERRRLHLEGSSAVLTPRAEIMLRSMRQQADLKKTVAGAIVHGEPGVGKSQLIREHARQLPGSNNGICHITINAITVPSSTIFFEPSARPVVDKSYNEFLATILKAEADQTKDRNLILQDAVRSLFRKKVLPFCESLPPQRHARVGFSYLEFMIETLQAHRIDTEQFEHALQEQNPITDGTDRISHIENEFLIELIADSPALMQLVKTYLALEATTATEPAMYTKTLAYEAMRRGMVVICEEAEKGGDANGPMGMGGFGSGLEHFLETKPGSTVALGPSMLLPTRETSAVLATANSLEPIADHILRRMQLIQMQPAAEDVVFIARTLLSDGNGRSLLRENGRHEVEHHLVSFLWWFDAVSHHMTYAIRQNVITLLCTYLVEHQDASFKQALDMALGSLDATAQAWFRMMRRHAPELPFERSPFAAPLTREQSLSLAEMNLLLCRATLQGNPTGAVPIQDTQSGDFAAPITPPATPFEAQADSSTHYLRHRSTGTVMAEFATQGATEVRQSPLGHLLSLIGDPESHLHTITGNELQYQIQDPSLAAQIGNITTKDMLWLDERAGICVFEGVTKKGKNVLFVGLVSLDRRKESGQQDTTPFLALSEIHELGEVGIASSSVKILGGGRCVRIDIDDAPFLFDVAPNGITERLTQVPVRSQQENTPIPHSGFFTSSWLMQSHGD